MQGRATDTKFAQFNRARRIWAVASIHGEAARLSRLHDQIARRFADGDAIVYLGNYLGRGSAVAATVDELLDFRRRVLARPGGSACEIVFLRGAHEEMWQKLLQLQFAANPGEVLAWMVREGVEATVQAYGGELRYGFASHPRRTANDHPMDHDAAQRDERGARPHGAARQFAPCGVERGRPPVVCPCRGRCVAPACRPGRRLVVGGRDILDLTAPFDGFGRVVCGFDRQMRGLVEGEFAVSLDAGAGRGGPLLAAAFAADGAVLEVLEA